MGKKSNIYTRTGDKGQTSLANGERVEKSDLHMQVCGGFDEANAFLGLALSFVDTSHPANARLFSIVRECQDKLFAAGAIVAGAKTGPDGLCIGAADISWIESQLDHFDAELPPLKNFILPGGNNASAFLHVARTVVRRAERSLVRLVATEQGLVLDDVAVFINRLSDLLFVLARTANNMGKGDIIWSTK